MVPPFKNFRPSLIHNTNNGDYWDGYKLVHSVRDLGVISDKSVDVLTGDYHGAITACSILSYGHLNGLRFLFNN